MAQVQKPHFVFRRNRRVLLNRRGRQFSRLLGSRGVRISGSNAGYTMFRGSVKSTGYPLHSLVSPSLPLPAAPCAITFQPESTPPVNLLLALHFFEFHHTVTIFFLYINKLAPGNCSLF